MSKSRIIGAVLVVAAIAIVWVCLSESTEMIQLRLQLGDKDPLVREKAIRTCIVKGPDAVAVLISASKNKISEVGRAAVQALGRMKESKAVEALIQALQDPAWQGRTAVLDALGRSGDPRAVEPLLGLLSSPAYRRRDVVAALCMMEDARVGKFLMKTLKESDTRLWADVAELAQPECPWTLEVFVQALKEPNKEIRQSAVRGLSRIRDARVVEPLVKALKDRDEGVRQAAIFALAHSGDPPL